MQQFVRTPLRTLEVRFSFFVGAHFRDIPFVSAGEISSLVTLVGHGSRFYVNCLSCPTLLESGLALFAFGSVNYDPLSFTVSISTTDHPANVTSTSVGAFRAA